MSKTITSPVKHFPGTITLAQPLTYPQYIAWTEGLEKYQAICKDKKASIPSAEVFLWAGIKELVEKCEIQNLSFDKIPSTPRTAILRLLGWLVDEIGKIVDQEDEDSDPNA